MIDKICLFLTNRIRKEMPEIDDEKAEVINYGLQNIVGEIPKTFIMLGVAWVLGIFKWALITFIILLPYRGASGGVHLKTHLGCIIGTIIFYCGVPFLAKYLVLSEIVKYFVIGILWIFGMVMIKLYAPADTEDVPILAKKDRKKKQIASYLTFSMGLIIALFISNTMLVNILILGSFVQTISITKLAYRLTNNKYGYEVYGDTSMESA